MFGREPRLPIDLAFGINNQQQKTLTKYIEDLRQKMKKAYEIATSSASQARRKQKEGYDIKSRGSSIKEGDRVLVKIVAFDGKHKISDRWEEDIYEVIRQPNPRIPVYVVQKENGEGKKRTLHRNLLLPIGHLDGFQQPDATPSAEPEPKKTSVAKRPTNDPTRQEESHQVDTTSESEDELQIEAPVPNEADVYTPHDVQDTTEEESQEGAHVEDAQLADVADPTETEHQQPSSDGDMSQDDRDVSGAEGNTPEDDEEPLVGDDDDEDDEAEEEPRRSTRQRTQPSWMTSGEYVQMVHPQDKEKWKGKLLYLQNLLLSGACRGYEKQIIDAIMDFMKQ